MNRGEAFITAVMLFCIAMLALIGYTEIGILGALAMPLASLLGAAIGLVLTVIAEVL